MALQSWFLWLLLGFGCLSASAQNGLLERDPTMKPDSIMMGRGPFTKKDSLRGVLSPARAAYDVVYYNLQIRVLPGEQSVRGWNEITYRVLEPLPELQLDLFANMSIDSVTAYGKRLTYRRIENTFWVKLDSATAIGKLAKVRVWYHGQPIAAANPPWDGGFVWRTDSGGKPWVTVACEGTGASCWWPLKDHPSDEPDSMRIGIETPPGLYTICNGELKAIVYQKDGFSLFDWNVSYPINSYNVTLNMGDYGHLQDVYISTKQGLLQLDYYVLKGHEQAAQKHFQQVKTMLGCFEKYLGPYPFWKDGYALVETPYWGMEHQGAVAYGNHFKNNDFGFDFIIIHESGHEWFGNNISCADHADLWIHESFTTYTEFLYLECTKGYQTALEYLKRQRNSIRNQDAILGPLNVNFNDWKNSDMYYKGTWMLHTIRRAVDNDTLFLGMLRRMNERFSLKQINTDSVIAYFNANLHGDVTAIFNQYLLYPSVPTFQYSFVPTDETYTEFRLKYRWVADVAGFNVPVNVKNIPGIPNARIAPKTGEWKYLDIIFYKTFQLEIEADDFLGNIENIRVIAPPPPPPQKARVKYIPPKRGKK
jgi:aminopeptidase N